MGGGGGGYQCRPGQSGRSHAVNSLGARGGAEQGCRRRGERSGAGLRAPRSPEPAPVPPTARPAMAAAVDDSTLPSISTFANLLPLEERPADMLHVSTGVGAARGGGLGGTGQSVPGWGSARLVGADPLPPSEGAPGAAQPERCRPVGRVGGSRRPEREARTAVPGRRAPPQPSPRRS